MRFWLFDLEFDYNPSLENKCASIYFQIFYVTMMIYTVLYALYYQKDNRFTNSSKIIVLVLIILGIIVAILGVLLMIIQKIRNRSFY